MTNKKYNILYVDDEYNNRNVLEATYREEYNIIACESGKEGLMILKKQPVELIITDQEMPEMTGIEFLLKAQKFSPEAKRILLTDSLDNDVIKESINKIGIYRYINKPIHYEEINLEISNALEAYQFKIVANDSEQALKDSELQKSIIFETALDAMINVDQDGKVLDWNVQATEIFGWTKAEAIDKPLVDLIILEDQRQIYKQELNNYRNTGTNIIVNKRLETECRRKDGTLIPVEVSIVPIELQDKTIFSGFIRDISERKLSSEKMIAAVLEAEDQERKRMAKGLHDSLGQNLTVSVLNLDGLGQEIGNLSKDLQKKYQTGMEFLNRAIDESRTIAHNLIPKGIDDFGLVLAVQSILDGLKDSSETTFEFHDNLGEERLSSSVEVALYRISQEAVNNIIKYSEAKHATIQLIKHPNEVIYTIEDDGRGFDMRKLDDKARFGLNSIQNRAKSISAHFELSSSLGRGTHLMIEIPYPTKTTKTHENS